MADRLNGFPHSRQVPVEVAPGIVSGVPHIGHAAVWYSSGMPTRVAVTFTNVKKAEPYEAALRAAGIEPVRLGSASLRGVAGLLLTGGTDVDPFLYGAERHPETAAPDRPRDGLELAALDQALAEGIPVFAICRGMQLLNVSRGGTLIQHLDGGPHRQPGCLDAHDIEVAADSRLAAIIGPGRHTVNSRHHQAAGRLGRGLAVTARAADVVEAVELSGPLFVLGVQWHPEDRVSVSPADRSLFEAFAEAAASRPR